MESRRLLILGLVLSFTIVSLSLLMLLYPTPTAQTASTNEVLNPPSFIRDSAVSIEQDFTDENSQTDVPVTLEDLIFNCPDPFLRDEDGLGSLPDECVAVLESYFIDLPYIPVNGFQWLQIPHRVAYRRIFDNPAQGRDFIFEALSRPECRFEDGKKIRPDLQETCLQIRSTYIRHFFKFATNIWIIEAYTATDYIHNATTPLLRYNLENTLVQLRRGKMVDSARFSTLV